MSNDDENGSTGFFEGNTRTSKKLKLSEKKPRASAAKHWCFTLNNYTEDEYNNLAPMFLLLNCRYIYGKEVGESGTKHLQGFIESDKKFRPMESLGRLARSALTTGCRLTSIHWEAMRGTREQAIKYCMKEDRNPITNFNLLDEFEPYIPDPLGGIVLSQWQVDILEMIENPYADRRHIHWYWSEKGGVGKSSLKYHILMNYKRACEAGGKGTDCKHLIAERKAKGQWTGIVIFDLPREREEHLSYEAIEQIKNGSFFSGKYESSNYLSVPPHVIVFANFKPDESKMSEDRWKIFEIV